MRILTLALITIAFVINAYAIVEVILSGLEYPVSINVDSAASSWRWGLLYSVVPEAITVLALGLAFRLNVKAT